MAWEDLCQNKVEAGKHFSVNTPGGSERLAASLCDGMIILRDVLYLRLHEDVERIIGTDSMYVPISEVRSQRRTKAEIELFQAAESAAAVRACGYVGADVDAYWHWLLRFSHCQPPSEAELGTVANYLAQTPDARRLAFTDVLSRIFPEARRAPLVLFRLYPLAVQLATSLAFGDRSRAERIRADQAAELPAVADCTQCRGRVLDNGQQCRTCGNPLWRSELLMAPG